MPVRRPSEIDDEDTRGKPWSDDDDDDDDDRRPRRARRSSRDTRDEEDSDRYTEEDSDDYEAPRSSRVRRGWEVADREMKSRNSGGDGEYSEPENFLLAYQASNQPRLIRFLDNQPMIVRRHYWDRGEIKGYFVCLEGDCPMCDAGSDARAQGVFTVVDLTPDKDGYPPHRRFLYASKRLLNQLRDRDDDPKYGPLTKSYMAISKSGTGKDTTYTVTYVKDRDLEDDWDMSAAEAREICGEFEAAGEEKLGLKTRRELRDIVRG